MNERPKNWRGRLLADKRAHRAVRLAIRAGTLPRPGLCESCGTRHAYLYHHWSYEPEHWLDVIPLCDLCHRRVHAGRLVEPRTGRLYFEMPKPGPVEFAAMRRLLARISAK